MGRTSMFNFLMQKSKLDRIPEGDTKIVDKGEFCMNTPLIDLAEIELRDLSRHHIDTFQKKLWR